MSDFQFANIDHLKRNRTIEGETGTELGLDGGITLIVLAATDANPRWKANGRKVVAELNRLKNAQATARQQRDYLAGVYAENLVIGWYYVDPEDRRHDGPLDPNGHAIPFTIEACKAFLIEADDAFAAVDGVVYDTKNFRGERLKVVVDAGKA